MSALALLGAVAEHAAAAAALEASLAPAARAGGLGEEEVAQVVAQAVSGGVLLVGFFELVLVES